MKIKEVINVLEKLAPPSLQEAYDNSGLQIGMPEDETSACLISLDVTEGIIEEARRRNCGLVISHHPLIFHSLKRISESTATERIIMKAIRYGIAIYSVHTNLDNVIGGVNGKLCEKLGLINTRILKKAEGQLMKLVTFCPTAHAEKVREAIFAAGAGQIGNYDQCSFNAEGQGSFRANENAHPFTGELNQLHFEKEVRIETIFPVYREKDIIQALMAAHPYEEVAYDLYKLENEFALSGAGMIGELPDKIPEKEFLQQVKNVLGIPIIRHSVLPGKNIKKVAVCGGSGSFLLNAAISSGADIFLTGDIKYHQFFDADGKIILADVGHYESEQFTIELIADYLKEIFPTFALLISERSTNSVNYF